MTSLLRKITRTQSSVEDGIGSSYEFVEEMRKYFRDHDNMSVDKFEIDKTLGTGTFGRVRLAKLRLPSKDKKGCFALKMMKKREIIRLKQVEHIKAERKILLMTNHPFIVDFYGTFQDDRKVYMVMEYVCGGEMFTQLRKNQRFPPDTARLYAAEIILALEHLHSENIVYRDLKPENLLFDKDGHIKITDFGFSKIVEDRTWTLCGTPEYLAPEIIQSKGHGKSVDWWAMGVLIYEMLAGYPPFYDENPFGIYQKILAGKLDFPRHFDANARDLVRKLLTTDRSQRFGCLKDGAEDIKRHKWFKNIDWGQVYKRKVAAPWVPPVKSEDDTTLFDEYPDSPPDSSTILGSTEQDLFTQF